MDALYLFVNDNILLRGGNILDLTNWNDNLFCELKDQSLKDVYEKYKDSDGFLYISYCEYSSFGMCIEWI